MPHPQHPNTPEACAAGGCEMGFMPFFITITLAIVAVGFLLERPRVGAVFSHARVFFAGPDDYLRTYRAKQIADGQTVHVRHMMEINAPAGAELHWTAPMDYLLAGAGILFGPLINHADPFGCVAAWVPTCLGAFYVICMMGMVHRGFGWEPAVLAGLMVVLSPAFHRVFQIGHPDHHCLLELLLLVALGAWVPSARADGTPGTPTTAAAVVSGLAIGLAMWVAAQAVFLWVALIVGLTVACLTGPPRARQAYAHARFTWNCATGIVVVIGFLFENQPDLHATAVDKISTVHLALLAIGFLAPIRVPHARSRTRSLSQDCGTARPTVAAKLWHRRPACDLTGETPVPQISSRAAKMPNTSGTSVSHRDGGIKGEIPPELQSQTNRTIAFLTAVAAFCIWMTIDRDRAFEHVSQPEFFRWSGHIAELQPLYHHTTTDWSLQPMHAWVGFLPYALPLLVVFFVRSKQVPRPVRCTLGLLAPAIMILTIIQLRWLDHFNLAVTPVAVIGMWELVRALIQLTSKGDWKSRRAGPSSTPDSHITRRKTGAEDRPARPASRVGATGGLPASEHGQASCPWHTARFILAAAALAILTYPSAKIVASLTTTEALHANVYQERTDFVSQHITAYENAHPSPDPSRRAILCEDGEGPMLLYCTDLPVVATPYHRALDGLIEAARFFAERDPLEARRQLDRLGVRYVVMPPRAHEQLMHFEKIAFGELRSFDPPTETINRFGRIMQKLNYRPREVSQTMAYRLVMEPDDEVIPGVKRIAEIQEGATTPDGKPMKTGLLYVVNHLPPDN